MLFRSTADILTLETPPLSEDEAFEMYYRSSKQHKKIIVAHYCVANLYEVICVLLDYGRDVSEEKRHRSNSGNARHDNRSGRNGRGGGGIPTITDLFFKQDEQEDLLLLPRDGDDRLCLEDDEWRPLFRVLYNRSADEYTKRGSALILAFILMELFEKCLFCNSTVARGSHPFRYSVFSWRQKWRVEPNHFGSLEGRNIMWKTFMRGTPISETQASQCVTKPSYAF